MLQVGQITFAWLDQHCRIRPKQRIIFAGQNSKIRPNQLSVGVKQSYFLDHHLAVYVGLSVG